MHGAELQEAARRGFAGWAPPTQGQLKGQYPAAAQGVEPGLQALEPAGAVGVGWEVPCSRRRLPSALSTGALSLGQHAPGGGREAGSPPLSAALGTVSSSGQRAVGSRALPLSRTEAESPLQ